MRKLFVFLFVLLSCFVLVGCGQANDYNDGASTDSVIAETSRKIYYVIDLNVQTKSINESIDAFNEAVTSCNGYISSSDISNNDVCYITYRVPTNKLNEFLNIIKDSDISVVENQKIKSTDITTTYNEVDARISVLQASRLSYINLLEKAESITDIIAIQSRIEEIDAEILKLETEKSSYDNLIDYSTINIQLYEGNIGFVSSYLNYIVTFFKVIGIVILYLLPIALIALAIIFITKFINKKYFKNKIN